PSCSGVRAAGDEPPPYRACAGSWDMRRLGRAAGDEPPPYLPMAISPGQGRLLAGVELVHEAAGDCPLDEALVHEVLDARAGGPRISGGLLLQELAHRLLGGHGHAAEVLHRVEVVRFRGLVGV